MRNKKEQRKGKKERERHPLALQVRRLVCDSWPHLSKQKEKKKECPCMCVFHLEGIGCLDDEVLRPVSRQPHTHSR